MTSIIHWGEAGPEIAPLTTVEQLLSWRPTEAENRLCQAVEPLPARRDGGMRADRPRLLCCHDMRGGYLEDRFIQGGGDAGGYTFRHWEKIDGFVYFSHELVTLPPTGWINASHTHGVPIFGTFITEWKEGEAACEALLATDGVAEHAAHQLAFLAEFLGFDGWIINIENEVSPSLMPRLLHFVRCLTAAVHAAVPASGAVIWYDAVTIEGHLKWQNNLTPLNAPFLDVCDGIWINYTWTETTPAEVRAAAGKRGFDVYLGIDAFGRGTYGGGGLACNVALAAALREGVSVALFACGWPFEKYHELQAQDAKEAAEDGTSTSTSTSPAVPTKAESRPNRLTAWQSRDDEFWKLIAKSWGVKRATLCSLPIFSDFSIGLGTSLVQGGHVAYPAAWYNLSLQSPLPVLSFLGKRPQGMHARVTTAAAFNGGSSILLAGRVQSPVHLRLFRAAAPVSPAGLRVRFTAAASAGVQLSLCLRLRRRRPGGGSEAEAPPWEKEKGKKVPSGAEEQVIELRAARAGSRSNIGGNLPFEPSSILKLSSQATSVPFTWLPGEADGASLAENIPLSSVPREWTTWHFAVAPGELSGWPLAGSVITSIEIVAAPKTPGTACPCYAFIGAVSVWGMNQKDTPPLCVPVESLLASDIEVTTAPLVSGGSATQLSVVLRWTAPPWIQRCHIWARVGILKHEITETTNPNLIKSTGNKILSSPGTKEALPPIPEAEPSVAPSVANTMSPGTSLESPLVTPIKGVDGPLVWSAYRWVGVASGTAFGVTKYVVPEGAVAVRFCVATSAWTASQPLRASAAVTIPLQQLEESMPSPLGEVLHVPGMPHSSGYGYSTPPRKQKKEGKEEERGQEEGVELPHHQEEKEELNAQPQQQQEEVEALPQEQQQEAHREGADVQKAEEAF